MSTLFNPKMFEEFIYESFEGCECYQRELRLSDIEREYLANKYPNATIVKLTDQSSSDKQWYDVRLGAF